MTQPTTAKIGTRPPLRLLARIHDVLAAVPVSRRTLSRLIAVGKFPAAELRVGGVPMWRVSTVERWVEDNATGEDITAGVRHDLRNLHG